MIEIKQTIDALEAALKDTFKRVDLDGSNLAKRTEIDVRPSTEGLTVSVTAPDYIFYVDKGRRPGKKPPVKDILAWIKDKNIPTSGGITQEQLAFAISNSISRDGVRGKDFLDRLRVEIRQILVAETREALNNEVRNTLKTRR